MRTYLRAFVVVVFVALLALPVAVLAQDEPGIYWGAWGRAIFAPAVSNNEGETVPREMASWGWDSRIGFTLRGHSEKIGFHVDMKADTGNLGSLQDQQKIWAKPFESLTIEFGPNVFYDTLRGNSEFGAWNWIRFNNMEGEDNIFARGQAGGGDGTRTPSAQGGFIMHSDINGWHLFGALNVLEEGEEIQIGDDIRDTNGDGNADREAYTTALMFQRGQYGVGYDIEGFGQARIQYIGHSYVKSLDSDTKENYGVINGALRIDQAIEKLYLDVGFFVPTDSDSTAWIHTTRINGYAKYTLSDKVTTHFLVVTQLDKEDAKGDEGLGLKLGLGAGIDLGNGYSADLDLRYHNETAVAVEGLDSQIGFLAGVKKFLGNGVVGIGFQGTTYDFGGGVVSKENVDDFAWAIPITLEYWF